VIGFLVGVGVGVGATLLVLLFLSWRSIRDEWTSGGQS
jgi:hypothetical protein